MTAEHGVSPERSGLLTRVLAWLRAGYPQGVPQSDYVALFAVLHRDLTEYEVVQVAEELVRDRDDQAITHAEVEVAVSRYAREQAGPEDIARVASHLAAGGWPLASPLAEIARPDEDR
ncbi:DUF3349 domain-containing protein [Nocardia jinanensis]|uniref:DUF3349 domain-containing protein n=1 Tax=Nocardia jinanensis TaxID=382504 RepID=A0A917RTK9_9NOCA|nr:DUF3349 domain-containing protein [Nocardia jinanensis]GGL28734.1 hypothetical protein GCM10011588_49560 [Nocardia jinanensis]